MSTRERIKMSEEERLAFLGEERTVIVTSFGPKGWPHSMPMWFVVRDGEVWMWTYRSSQKVRNLERDPRATLLVETGETYDQLRGVMIEAEAEIVDEYDAVLALGRELGGRYAPGAAGPEAEQALAHQAGKRVGIRFGSRRVVSWDHRKL
ncbi:MAG: pyridoxamine 5-phosphate oxidase-related FMN-binding protein [Solirubrobacterales bacterium]|nr:pyridoxamine 5-phosphate oxidase-related FMN-binding protein [Solirubrobacterales bacterium]